MLPKFPNRIQLILIFLYALLRSALIYGQDNPYSITDTRNSKEYPVVKIGNQWWMAKNLDIGEMIPDSTDMSYNDNIEKYCLYNNPAYCDTFGGLYQWDELMQYTITESAQGICPDGWHIPSDMDWKILEVQLGMSHAAADSVGYRGTNEGGKLKFTGSDFWAEPNNGATNEAGFNLLGAGARSPDGTTGYNGFMTDFWTSSAINDSMAWYRMFGNEESRIFRADGYKPYGTSARCVKNTFDLFETTTITDARDGKVYKIVKIGAQWWMAENLNVGNQINSGTPQSDNQVTEKYCYNNDAENCNMFGGLYQWNEAMNHNPDNQQGICPANWHVPTDADWKLLEHRLGIDATDIEKIGWDRGTDQGTFLKSEGGSGFDVYLGGATNPSGVSENQTEFGYFWNSTSVDDNFAWARVFGKDSATINRNNYYFKENGFSIRCIQDTYTPITAKIIAPEIICSGDKFRMQAEIQGGNGNYSFDWTSADGSHLSSADTLVTTPTVESTYYLMVEDGESMSIDSVTVKINSLPVSNINGHEQVCASESNTTYTTESNPEYNYEWYTGNGIITSVINSNQVEVNWETLVGIKSINLLVINKTTGCQLQKSLNVEVLPAPQKPILVRKAQTYIFICTDSGFVYQWYRNEIPITGETKQFYDARENTKKIGEIYVEVSQENGCKNRSESYIFPAKSSAYNEDQEQYKVFIHPNPNDGIMTIEIFDDFTGLVNIQLVNCLGQFVRRTQIVKPEEIFESDLDLRQIEAGVYFLIIDVGFNREIHRIFINKAN